MREVELVLGLFFGVRLVFGMGLLLRVGVVFWGWGCFLGLVFYLLAGSGLVGCSLPAVGGTPGKRGSESQKEKLNWEE